MPASLPALRWRRDHQVEAFTGFDPLDQATDRVGLDRHRVSGRLEWRQRRRQNLLERARAKDFQAVGARANAERQ